MSFQVLFPGVKGGSALIIKKPNSQLKDETQGNEQ